MWEVLKLFDACTRYEMYDYWFRSGISLTIGTVFNMLMTEKTHEIDDSLGKGVIDWCKKLNNETTKENGKLLGRLSSSNPLVAFDIVLSNLRSYTNLIEPTLSALNYLSPLTLD